MRATLSRNWPRLGRLFWGGAAQLPPGLSEPDQVRYAEIMGRHHGEPLGIEFRHREADRWACILPNVSGGPAFKLQFFDGLAFSGHELFGSVGCALARMLSMGYRDEDAGALERVSATERWARALKTLSMMQELSGVFLREQA